MKKVTLLLATLLCGLMLISCEKAPEEKPGEGQGNDDQQENPQDDPQESDEAFDIDLTTEDLTITMAVTPQDDRIRYYFDIIDTYLLKDAGDNLEMLLKMILEDRIAMHTDMGMSVEEAVEKITSQGPDSYTYSRIQKANTTFIGYAVEVDPQGNMKGDIVTDEITTRPTASSDNVISIDVFNINVDKADVAFTTTNDDPWLYIVEPAENWKGVEDEEILKTVCSIYSLAEFVTIGDFQSPVTQMTASTTYVVFAFGFAEGTYTTGLFKKEFTTLKSDGPVDSMTFEFQVLSKKKNSINAQVTGTPETALYYFDICKADQSQSEVEKELEKVIKQQMADMGIRTRTEYFSYMGSRGTAEYPFQGLKPNTGYRIYAMQIDENTGDYVGEWVFSDVITTPSE